MLLMEGCVRRFVRSKAWQKAGRLAGLSSLYGVFWSAGLAVGADWSAW